jgi:DNA-binding transcriptional ArsR family regulator
MSWEAENWARAQRTGDPVTKAVLVGIANWMNPKGDECQVSLRRLADEVEISLSTARRHIRRLEDMGLIEKSSAYREDGGQGWNSFVFPTYRPPKVSHVEPTGKRTKPPVNLTPPHVKLTGGEGSNLTPSPVSDCDGEGVTADTPETCKGVSKSPPTPPPGGDADEGKRNRGSRIAVDWTPPPIASLPPAAKAKALQWPAGAYEAEAEAFRDYWLGEGRAGARKLDWNSTWRNRINECTARVLRDAKAGVRHPVRSTGPAEPPKALDSSREGKGAQEIRRLIRKRLGDQVYDQWIAPSRLDAVQATLTLVAVSMFASNYQRDNFANEIAQAMHAVLGPDAELRFHHERPPS